MGRPLCAPPEGPDAPLPRSALRRGLRGPGTHVLGGLAHWARARDRQTGCPLKKGRWRRALSPRDRRCCESPRTCQEQETGLITGRGGSPEQELGERGAAAPPPARDLHRCARGARRTNPLGAEAYSCEPGARRPVRVPSGDRQGSCRLPRAPRALRFGFSLLAQASWA